MNIWKNKTLVTLYLHNHRHRHNGRRHLKYILMNIRYNSAVLRIRIQKKYKRKFKDKSLIKFQYQRNT